VLVVDSNVVEDVDFYHALLVEFRLVSNDFQSDLLLLHVVVTEDYLTERPSAQLLDDLEPEGYLVIGSETVVVFVIIEAPVFFPLGKKLIRSVSVLVDIVDFFVLQDFLLLDGVEHVLVEFKGNFWREGKYVFAVHIQVQAGFCGEGYLNLWGLGHERGGGEFTWSHLRLTELLLRLLLFVS